MKGCLVGQKKAVLVKMVAIVVASSARVWKPRKREASGSVTKD